MVETVIIDQDKPENDPSVFIGDWSLAITRKEEQQLTMVHFGGDVRFDDAFSYIGNAIKTTMIDISEKYPIPLDVLIDSFMKGMMYDRAKPIQDE